MSSLIRHCISFYKYSCTPCCSSCKRKIKQRPVAEEPHKFEPCTHQRRFNYMFESHTVWFSWKVLLTNVWNSDIPCNCQPCNGDGRTKSPLKFSSAPPPLEKICWWLAGNNKEIAACPFHNASQKHWEKHPIYQGRRNASVHCVFRRKDTKTCR